MGAINVQQKENMKDSRESKKYNNDKINETESSKERTLIKPKDTSSDKSIKEEENKEKDEKIDVENQNILKGKENESNHQQRKEKNQITKGTKMSTNKCIHDVSLEDFCNICADNQKSLNRKALKKTKGDLSNEHSPNKITESSIVKADKDFEKNTGIDDSRENKEIEKTKSANKETEKEDLPVSNNNHVSESIEQKENITLLHKNENSITKNEPKDNVESKTLETDTKETNI